ncbi:MAG: bifunctional riboflavin kinase/FAD synthetase [Candidatus Omnitrophota bacterium]
MRTVAAIGIFDGVHIGHKKIIKTIVRLARKSGSRSVVITFDPHPLKVLNPRKPVPLIMSTSHRVRLIRDLGVDDCYVIRFNKKFSFLDPEAFVKKTLMGKFNVSDVCVGDNFVFGKGNAGNVVLLRRLGEAYGFKVKAVSLAKVSGKTVSSTLVRNLIINGKLKEASRLLGRPIAIFGTVIGGLERGRSLGYPTANINPHHEAIPPSGIYAVWINLRGRKYGGALFIGHRPTFGEKEPVVEVHIFNFNAQIYGEDIEVTFVKRLRGVRKFSDKQKLIKQIGNDDIMARKILGLK